MYGVPINKLFKKDYICPYCFNRHDLYDVKFRCENERCDLEEDPVYSNFNGYSRPREMQRVITPEKPENFVSKLTAKMPSECHCDECEEQTTLRICPSCHSELPSTIGNYEDLIFAVVGAKETGKSHYISVLIDKLMKEIGEAYDCLLEPINDETIHRYREDFWTPVFKRNETIQATRSGKADERVRRPLLYTLKFTKKGLFQKTKIDKVITLAFFDAAGEDLDAEDTMQTVNKYIYNSAGIILLLDPLQLDNVRENIPENIHLPNINSDSDEILYRMTNMIRKAVNIKQNEKIDIPLAVAFSKIDAVEPMLDPASPLRFPSQHTEAQEFDVIDFENVQSEIEVLIKDWSESGMTRTLDANYKSFGYFGISSLGYNPDSDMKIKELKPYRVADPFLWLLSEHNIIDAKKRK